MSDHDERVTGRVEELVLSNSLQLTGFVVLPEGKGLPTQAQIVERVG
jgi:hypothetical protein